MSLSLHRLWKETLLTHWIRDLVGTMVSLEESKAMCNTTHVFRRYQYSFELNVGLFSIVKPTRCTISQIYFGTTLYMFQTVSPSIIRSL
jgi:hypothetical protein